jgi:hypothetical protein
MWNEDTQQPLQTDLLQKSVYVRMPFTKPPEHQLLFSQSIQQLELGIRKRQWRTQFQNSAKGSAYRASLKLRSHIKEQGVLNQFTPLEIYLHNV